MDLTIMEFSETSIKDGFEINKAARAVVNEYRHGKQVLVVVSALKKTTDGLVLLSNEAVGDDLTAKQEAEIISMGEVISARLFAAAIKSLGVESKFVDPISGDWPIITDDDYLNANIDFEKTSIESEKLKSCLDEGVIPVLCGFLGKTPKDEITILGFDDEKSTFVLGNCLNACEVIIVNKFNNVILTDLKNEESAEYKLNLSHTNVKKITSEDETSTINDALISCLKSRVASYSIYDEPISCIAITGKNLYNHDTIADLIFFLEDNEINVLNVSTSYNSIAIYINKNDSKRAYVLLHEFVIDYDELSAISLGKDLAMISLSGLNDDVVKKIMSCVEKLFKTNNIYIEQIYSSQRTANILVEWNEGIKSYNLIKYILKSER